MSLEISPSSTHLNIYGNINFDRGGQIISCFLLYLETTSFELMMRLRVQQRIIRNLDKVFTSHSILVSI